MHKIMTRLRDLSSRNVSKIWDIQHPLPGQIACINYLILNEYQSYSRTQFNETNKVGEWRSILVGAPPHVDNIAKFISFLVLVLKSENGICLQHSQMN